MLQTQTTQAERRHRPTFMTQLGTPRQACNHIFFSVRIYVHPNRQILDRRQNANMLQHRVCDTPWALVRDH